MNIAQLGQFRNEFGSLNGKFAFPKFIFQAFQNDLFRFFRHLVILVHLGKLVQLFLFVGHVAQGFVDAFLFFRQHAGLPFFQKILLILFRPCQGRLIFLQGQGGTFLLLVQGVPEFQHLQVLALDGAFIIFDAIVQYAEVRLSYGFPFLDGTSLRHDAEQENVRGPLGGEGNGFGIFFGKKNARGNGIRQGGHSQGQGGQKSGHGKGCAVHNNRMGSGLVSGEGDETSLLSKNNGVKSGFLSFM